MLTNRRRVRIEWGDCDPAGIVFYPRYFAMFDASTQYLFEAAGFPKPRMLADFDLVGYPIVDTRARFMIPSRFGDDIAIETRIAGWGRSSFEVEHRVYRAEALAIEAFETRVLVGRDAGRPGEIKSRPIPQAILGRFAGPDDERANFG
jgi:4-hydroxybenzoyl-CoA thioesterase